MQDSPKYSAGPRIVVLGKCRTCDASERGGVVVRCVFAPWKGNRCAVEHVYQNLIALQHTTSCCSHPGSFGRVD